MTSSYRKLRANGDIFVAVSLAGCLVLHNWPLPGQALFLGLLFATSRFRSIWHSIQNYNISLFNTYKGLYYNFRIVYTFLFFFLLLLHSDGLAAMETPLKVLLLCYIIVMNIDRFRWRILIYGMAAGAIAALVVGLFQTGLDIGARSAGATNPIRFGMIALTFGSVCAVGLLHSRGDKLLAGISLAGLLAGIGTAFTSGSRGALLALPLMLLPLAPLLWLRSSRALLTIAALPAIFASVLLLADVGSMSTRIIAAYSNFSSSVTGSAVPDRSVSDREKLLVLAYDLFRENPIVGVGGNGWDAAAERLAHSPNPQDRLWAAYNQAHNQYADDLAKGGIGRFILGLVNLFLPLYLFLKCKPFAVRKGSEFALAGVVVSVGFIIFCLTESLMILSLPSMVHATLTLYLLAGCDEARRKTADDVATAEQAELPCTLSGLKTAATEGSGDARLVE